MSEKKLGRIARRADARDLHMRAFLKKAEPAPPVRTSFWTKRAGFPLSTFGNQDYSDCTRAKQAAASLRMERIETRRTPTIAESEVLRVYLDMTDRFYGGGDTGAYEVDALSEWRRPDRTFRDTQGRPLTIDAFLRVDPSDQVEVRRALWLAGAHGIAVCFNLPTAWSNVEPPATWSVTAGQAFTGAWEPGSWGGHSMWARDYDEEGLWLVHTWGLPDQKVTWAAVAAYMDECHVVIDSMDYWRTRKPAAARALKLDAIKAAVNERSDTKIT